jgi:hypothetical protein
MGTFASIQRSHISRISSDRALLVEVVRGRGFGAIGIPLPIMLDRDHGVQGITNSSRLIVGIIASILHREDAIGQVDLCLH